MPEIPEGLSGCGICDLGWACEKHPDKPFPHDDCIGPGMPCTCVPKGGYPPNYYGRGGATILAEVDPDA